MLPYEITNQNGVSINMLTEDYMSFFRRTMEPYHQYAPHLEYANVDVEATYPFYDAAVKMTPGYLSPDVFTNLAFPGLVVRYECWGIVFEVYPYLMDEKTILCATHPDSPALTSIGYFDVEMRSKDGLSLKRFMIAFDMLNPHASNIYDDLRVIRRIGFPDDGSILSKYHDVIHAQTHGLPRDEEFVTQLCHWDDIAERAVSMWVGTQMALKNPLVKEYMGYDKTPEETQIISMNESNVPTRAKKTVGVKYVPVDIAMDQYNKILEHWRVRRRPCIVHGHHRHCRSGKIVWVHWHWRNVKGEFPVFVDEEPREVEIVPLFRKA